MLAERAYAKINLTLDVLGKREDGFHNVDMIMQTVDLSDVVWIEDTPGSDIEIDATVNHIPTDRRNVAYAAADAFRRHIGVIRGVRIHIEKHIPVAAGLAGGSADAAAVLRGLDRLWRTELSLEELASIGASVGSDVPFCVHGGCARATGRGEHIERVSHPLRAWVVLVRPPAFVSTADIYNALQPSDYGLQVASSTMIQALQEARFEHVRDLVSNGLMATTLRLYPEVSAMKERVEHTVRAPVFMSGSGPTLFCLVPTQSAGQRLYNALRGFAKEVYLCRFIGL